MTDGAVHASLEEKVGKCIVGWQGAEQYAQKKISLIPKLIEAANPTLVVVNLSKVPVGSVSSVIESGGPEEAKNNKGARVTFLVVKVVSPGWTWVGAPEKEAKAGGKGKAGAVKAPEVKEKLNALEGEHLLMHSYDLTNQRGVFVKSARSDDYVVISPGMVLSAVVWGKNFLEVFEGRKGEDLLPFDMGFVQLGVKNVGSKGIETGNMLEIKSFTKTSVQSLMSTRLLPPLASSLQESAVARTRFLDGSYLTTTTENTKQEWLKGSLSSTVSVVKVVAGQGTFAIGPDDILRFHVSQPLADLPCAQMTIQCDLSAFGLEANKDWVCKLFNVMTLAGAMELLVVVDSYKSNKQVENDEESVLEGFARPNVPVFIEALLTKKMQSAGSEIGFIKETFGDSSKNMAVFKLSAEVTVALDTRLLNKKRSCTLDGSKTTLVHPSATWERGHALHFFFDGRLVHYVVVPLTPDSGFDGSKHVLSTITAPIKWDDDVEIVESGDTGGAPVVEKKRKLVLALVLALAFRPQLWFGAFRP